MKKFYTNIEEALKELRPEDKVVKILNNKFAVVQSSFIGGGYDTPSVCGLYKNTIYFYCKWFNEAKDAIYRAESLPNVERRLLAFYTNVKLQLGCKWSFVNEDHRKYKRDFRRIKKLLLIDYPNIFNEKV